MSEQNPQDSPLRSAARFWEPRRLIYNAILTLVVFLWLILTWPHFRLALTLGSLEALIVLALAANLCYAAAYLADLFLQSLLSAVPLHRARRGLFTLGTALALVVENYSIVDEIYPYANQPPPSLIGREITMLTATFASNMNFPAPLAVLGFLAAVAGTVLGAGAILIFWFSKKTKFARTIGTVVAAGAAVYVVLLLGFSMASRTTTLSRGQEKYFCEIDCHLAYAVTEVKATPDGDYQVTLRTRFDETTTSPTRPKDAPLTPSPRKVRLVDSAGHRYAPTKIEGTPLLTPLKPADSYTTQLEFKIPKDATVVRLLVTTTPGWPDHLVIGDENSWLHKKTYFAM